MVLCQFGHRNEWSGTSPVEADSYKALYKASCEAVYRASYKALYTA
jgi:hypothetical protein